MGVLFSRGCVMGVLFSRGCVFMFCFLEVVY